MSQVPTVYFIDDSATMREVIKIAFRRENMNVVACHSGTTALAQMEQVAPDVVISDVIMPEKDGYEVCQYIRQHPRLGKTPVILMSGVVNRTVAEKAFGVKADELIRKPFQPQDLIARVKHLLNPKAAVRPIPPMNAPAASAALSSIFGSPASGVPLVARGAAPITQNPNANAGSSLPPSLANMQPPTLGEGSQVTAARVSVMERSAPQPVSPMPSSAARPLGTPRPLPLNGNVELQKLKIEVLRMTGLVKKLQAELQAEREYSRALEEHIKTLQEVE